MVFYQISDDLNKFYNQNLQMLISWKICTHQNYNPVGNGGNCIRSCGNKLKRQNFDQDFTRKISSSIIKFAELSANIRLLQVFHHFSISFKITSDAILSTHTRLKRVCNFLIFLPINFDQILLTTPATLKND